MGGARQVMLGTMKTWKDDKGYGFLKPDDPNFPDLFVHISSLQKANIKSIPQIGDRFTFEEGEGRNGKKQAVSLAKV